MKKFFVKARLNRMAEISKDLAQILVGTIVIPVFFDRFDILLVIIGIGLAFVFWTISIYLTK